MIETKQIRINDYASDELVRAGMKALNKNTDVVPRASPTGTTTTVSTTVDRWMDNLKINFYLRQIGHEVIFVTNSFLRVNKVL